MSPETYSWSLQCNICSSFCLEPLQAASSHSSDPLANAGPGWYWAVFPLPAGAVLGRIAAVTIMQLQPASCKLG